MSQNKKIKLPSEMLLYLVDGGGLSVFVGDGFVWYKVPKHFKKRGMKIGDSIPEGLKNYPLTKAAYKELHEAGDKERIR